MSFLREKTISQKSVILSKSLEDTIKTTTLFAFIIAPLIVFVSILNANIPAADSNETERRVVIIDTDTGNEIDDFYAIVRALIEPSFHVKALCSAQYHTQKDAPDNTVEISQNYNKKILELMGLQNIPHPMGANQPLPDKKTPRPSAAADYIIKTAHALKGQKLDVIVLGPMTNVASAILIDSTIVPEIRVHAMGLLYDADKNSWDKNEFNTNNDPHAMDVLLDTKGLDLQIMTASASRSMVFQRETVDEKLKGQGGIWDYLVKRWQNYVETKTWHSPTATEKHWIMWDIAIIEALVHPEYAEKVAAIPPPENNQRPVQVYIKINVPAMKKSYWHAMERAIAEGT